MPLPPGTRQPPVGFPLPAGACSGLCTQHLRTLCETVWLPPPSAEAVARAKCPPVASVFLTPVVGLGTPRPFTDELSPPLPALGFPGGLSPGPSVGPVVRSFRGRVETPRVLTPVPCSLSKQMPDSRAVRASPTPFLLGVLPGLSQAAKGCGWPHQAQGLPCPPMSSRTPWPLPPGHSAASLLSQDLCARRSLCLEHASLSSSVLSCVPASEGPP